MVVIINATEVRDRLAGKILDENDVQFQMDLDYNTGYVSLEIGGKEYLIERSEIVKIAQLALLTDMKTEKS